MKKLCMLMVSLLTILNCPACSSHDPKMDIENPNDSSEGNDNQEWDEYPPDSNSKAPMSGKVNLWEKGNIPTVTQHVNNSDGADFIPNMEVFTVATHVVPKGAIIICPGGAFQFRSMQNEGYDIANMFTPMGYQCFIVNYRISPYTMRESATDLQRAIRYVRAHASDYRITPEHIALVGFSAGGILNGEVLLNWQSDTNGSVLDSGYRPDELDKVSPTACAVGMIYSFYGKLSVSMNDVATLRAANLPPAFYGWGTRDGFAGQFIQNANAVREAGCEVETHILEGYPHGYGSGGNANVWGNDFDRFLTRIMSAGQGASSESHFTRSSLIADVMSDDAFGSYGKLLFPVQNGYWSGNTLEELRLAFYNYIDPDKTVEVVNYLKGQSLGGKNIFYDIYSESEKRADAGKRDTGIFFFKGKEDAPFAICNAGGAFACVGTGDGIASWRTMQNRLERLEALGIPTEFHAYNDLPHGFGLGTGTVAEGWINDAVNFWTRHISYSNNNQTLFK